MGDKPSPNCPTGFSEPRSGKFVEGMHRGFSRVDGKASELDLNGDFDEAGSSKPKPEAISLPEIAKGVHCNEISETTVKMVKSPIMIMDHFSMGP